MSMLPTGESGAQAQEQEQDEGGHARLAVVHRLYIHIVRAVPTSARSMLGRRRKVRPVMVSKLNTKASLAHTGRHELYTLQIRVQGQEGGRP